MQCYLQYVTVFLEELISQNALFSTVALRNKMSLLEFGNFLSAICYSAEQVIDFPCFPETIKNTYFVRRTPPWGLADSDREIWKSSSSTFESL